MIERPVLDLDGQPVMESEDNPLTITEAAVRALLSANVIMESVDKARRFYLAQKIKRAWPEDLSRQDRDIIYSAVECMFPPLIAGRVHEVLYAGDNEDIG